MISKNNLENILVIDIETVPQACNFSDLPNNIQQLWDEKTIRQRSLNESADTFYEKAGIFAEFGKIICLSVGRFLVHNNQISFRLKSFSSIDEQIILYEFSELLKNFPQLTRLCAHNGKEFDFPYLCRRFIINQIKIPQILNIRDKKPWEMQHLDTMELWKFGDYKHYTSLNLLATILNIETPKDDINGADVRNVFYDDNDLNRIVKYCQKDVITTAQVLLKLNEMDKIPEENITIVM